MNTKPNNKPQGQYTLEDQQEILRLAKVAVATHEDMESIYNLYKLYMYPNAAMYRTDCNCSGSISAYYGKLLEWYSANNQLFNVQPIEVKTTKRSKK